MKNKILYVVEGTRGSYDDYSWFIIGIFKNKIDAEICKVNFINYVKEQINSIPCPVPLELREKFDNYDLDGIENGKELEEKYFQWKYGLLNDWLDFNLESIGIREIETEKVIFDFPITPKEKLNEK